MHLLSAKVGPFKSIDTPQNVEIDAAVTVFVGMNESGKTVFLQALEKSDDALNVARFDPIEDYPRKDLSSYLKLHNTQPDVATELSYQLTDEEVSSINERLHTSLPLGFRFSVSHKYDNSRSIAMNVDEQPVISWLISESALSSDACAALKEVVSLRAIPEALKDVDLTEKDQAFLAAITTRVTGANAKWSVVVEHEVWQHLKLIIPKFLYFSEYELLPSKMNLTDLSQRVSRAESDPKQLNAEHRAVLALLQMADISVSDFTSGGYETLKAKIEAVSISLTDQIMAFWKQNEDLEVEVDIKEDASDEAPFNSGPNIYLRIKNRRHRGVSTPFRQRSRGFIWFFSFLVWFYRVQHQLETPAKKIDKDLILLLDEPGLSLHALAQDDFLKYIDTLAERHQVIYTTHSPFMVHSDRLHQVRVVEDKDKVGTVISDNISSSDNRTIFPLQAALGWTIAQNLVISERNLLVEGPSDLIYLKAVSSILEAKGRNVLRDDVTIVPTGGLDKVVTFVSLLGASGLKIVVLHDYRGVPEQKLMDLVKSKIVSLKKIVNVSQFRNLNSSGTIGQPTDIEDLFSPAFYLDYFNKTFSKQLGGTNITESTLPAGDRIINLIERYLADNSIQIRPSGGFNHYAVATYFVSNPPQSLDEEALSRFEALFKAVNDLF